MLCQNRFDSLWMVRVSLLLVSQFFPCKQGHCGVPSKICNICNITCFEINPIDPFQCDIIYRRVVSEERQPNLSLAKLPCHLWFSNDIRMRSWMVFGHSVKSPLLSVSLTHQPFHFSSSTLRLHPSFNF